MRPSVEADGDRLLVEVYEALLSEQPVEAVLDQVADALEHLLSTDSVALAAVEAGSDQMRVVVARPAEAPERSTRPLVLPLLAAGERVGALSIARRVPELTAGEIELARRFASAAALAVGNARSRSAIERQARTDDLTGLANRRAFREQLEREIAVAQRSRRPLSLLVLDGNKLKATNDTYGHAVGDELICALARVLVERLRKSDFAARIGGDEFAVLLPDTGVEGAERLAARLRDAYALAEVPAPDAVLSVGVSIGCATYDGAESAESLFGRADHRMYAAKASEIHSP